MSQIGGFRKLVSSPAGESILSQWMALHHESIEATLASSGRRRWTVIAEFAAENGLTDGQGNRPTEQTCKQTWKRAKARMARVKAARASLAKRAPPVLPVPIAVPRQVALPLVDPPEPTPAPVPPASLPARPRLYVEHDNDEPIARPSIFKTLK